MPNLFCRFFLFTMHSSHFSLHHSAVLPSAGQVENQADQHSASAGDGGRQSDSCEPQGKGHPKQQRKGNAEAQCGKNAVYRCKGGMPCPGNQAVDTKADGLSLIHIYKRQS